MSRKPKTRKATAVKPDKFFSSLQALVKEKEIDVGGPSEEEQILAKGATTAFWRVLRGILTDVASNLDEVNDTAIAQGADYEEVGKNTIVISLTKGIIKRLIDKVEDVKEVADEREENERQARDK